jgi:pimeloyl-ACP methyl ester carboxylesterase
MPFIQTSAGVQLHYHVHGTGPVTLLFLHGWGGSSDSWAGVVPHLDPARYRSLCLDLRGHGQSACPAAGYTWDDFNHDVLAVADHEQALQFIPIGFSSGGKLACHLAAHQAQRVLAQILVAPVAPGMVPIPRELGLQVCAMAADPQQSQPFFQSWFAADTPGAVVASGCTTIAQTPRRVLEATAEMTLWTSLAASIGKLALPTLVVTGDCDPIYHAAYQKDALLPHLQQATCVHVNTGHFIPLENPAGLADLISRFLLTV